MKKLFTGYFAVAAKYTQDATQVRIASMYPRFWQAKIKTFQPLLVWRNFRMWKNGLFKGDGKADYAEQMDLMVKSGELQKILAGIPDGSILLCYEKEFCTCHRSWLAEYLVKNQLADISEFPLAPARAGLGVRSNRSTRQAAR